MRGKFTRVSPAAFADKVGIPAGWFVMSYRWMPEKLNRRSFHGRWFKIKSTRGEVFRILRFSADLSGGPTKGAGEIVIDWPGWLDLYGRAEDVDGSIELEFTKAKWWQFPRLAVSHPDPTIRLSGLLGLLSVGLGFLSIILAAVAL